MELALLEQKAAGVGRMLMGRQIAFLIYKFFQTNPITDFTYGIEDLGRLAWTGDHNIPSFLHCWRLILSKMCVQLSDEELGEILYGKMCEGKELREDLARYNRKPIGHED
eukprot:4801160-Heterocapsa_arctica.AAC.1